MSDDNRIGSNKNPKKGFLFAPFVFLIESLRSNNVKTNIRSRVTYRYVTFFASRCLLHFVGLETNCQSQQRFFVRNSFFATQAFVGEVLCHKQLSCNDMDLTPSMLSIESRHLSMKLLVIFEELSRYIVLLIWDSNHLYNKMAFHNLYQIIHFHITFQIFK